MARLILIDPDIRYARLVQGALEATGDEVLVLTQVRGAAVRLMAFRPDAVLMETRTLGCTKDDLQQFANWCQRSAKVPVYLYSDVPEWSLSELAETWKTDGYLPKRGVPHLQEALCALLAITSDHPDRQAA